MLSVLRLLSHASACHVLQFGFLIIDWSGFVIGFWICQFYTWIRDRDYLELRHFGFVLCSVIAQFESLFKRARIYSFLVLYLTITILFTNPPLH